MDAFHKAFGPAIRITVVLLATLSAASPGSAQVIDSRLWGANGGVTTMARIGQTLYIGGGFAAVGPCTGGGVPADRASAVPRAAYPHVVGRVSAVVSDGVGGWFIGGH